MSKHLEPPADYLRAVAAEPRLRAVERAVDALVALVRPSYRLCYACVWERIVKPLVLLPGRLGAGGPTRPGPGPPAGRIVAAR